MLLNTFDWRHSACATLDTGTSIVWLRLFPLLSTCKCNHRACDPEISHSIVDYIALILDVSENNKAMIKCLINREEFFFFFLALSKTCHSPVSNLLAGHSPSVQTETGGGDAATEQLLQRHHTSEEEAERPHCVTNRVGAVQAAGLSRPKPWRVLSTITHNKFRETMP